MEETETPQDITCAVSFKMPQLMGSPKLPSEIKEEEDN